MGRHHQFRHPVLAQFYEGFHFPFKYSLEGLRILPFRMEGRHCLHAIEL